MEHDLYLDHAAQRVVKVTHVGFFGNHPALKPEGSFRLRPATPLEYLDRLALSNELFGVEQLVVGTVGGGLACQIVTEQMLVIGTRPTREEIDAYMDALGFRWVGDAKAYFRLSDGIGVFDVHGGNFLKGAGGQIFAFDVIPLRVSDRLGAALCK